jgi:hypothetical protein
MLCRRLAMLEEPEKVATVIDDAEKKSLKR